MTALRFFLTCLLIACLLTPAACNNAQSPAVSVSDPSIAVSEQHGAHAHHRMAASAVALYMRVRNESSEADTLIGASASVAREVQIHKTTIVGEIARMRRVERIPVAAGSITALESGGYHLMLISPDSTVRPGATVDVKLRFARAGELTVRADVRQR